MTRDTQPLAEIFGHTPNNLSVRARRDRKNRFCPFNNKVPNCTKDKANDPLGVCSVHHSGRAVITCPIRFRQDWMIAEDAADFFFPMGAKWTSLTEVRLADAEGKSAGNIDVVLAAYDEKGKVYDFGSLEVQAVYISGNVRDPYSHYMTNPAKHADMNWANQPNYPRPDFLSSSRKRLAPQLMFKGGILNYWEKKMAVALDSSFFATLPTLKPVDKTKAEIAWLIYELLPGEHDIDYNLTRVKTVYTSFSEALNTITRPKIGAVDTFLKVLQAKVDEKLEAAPINNTIDNPLGN